MAILSALDQDQQRHWQLHLDAARRDLPELVADVDAYLGSRSELPPLVYPSEIGDWLEHPERREFIEVTNGGRNDRRLGRD